MSRDGSIELTFHDGEEYVFRLAWGQFIRLQEERKCGPFNVAERLHGPDWLVDDIGAVIRLGFIGGGLDPIKAKKMVREYVENDAPTRSLALARDIIAAAVIPPEEEPLEKKAKAASGWTISRTGASESPRFTGPVH